MSRMIDAVRKSALPSNMMQFAARGALMVPPAEMIEILVYLAVHNPVFGSQAKATLAGWNVKSCLEVLANPATPKEVLNYFTDPANLGPGLLPALLENPSVGEDLLVRLARSATSEQVTILLENARVSGLRPVLEVLAGNPYLTPTLKALVQQKLSEFGSVPASSSVAETLPPLPVSEAESKTAASPETPPLPAPDAEIKTADSPETPPLPAPEAETKTAASPETPPLPAPEAESKTAASPEAPPLPAPEAESKTATSLETHSNASPEAAEKVVAEPAKEITAQADKPPAPVEATTPPPSPSAPPSPTRDSQRAPSMIDAIRKSALPSNIMQFAARGALMVSPAEMIEILVYLAKHNPVFGSQAKMTLAGWNVALCRDALANPATPREVLQYFTDPDNLRPALLSALLENPSVSDDLLLRLARSATREQVTILVDSARVCGLRPVLEVLAGNPYLTPALKTRIEEKLSMFDAPAPTSSAVAETVASAAASAAETQTATSPETPASDAVETDEERCDRFMAEHATEIAAGADKEFAPVEYIDEIAASEAEAPVAQAAAASAGGQPEGTATQKPGPTKAKKSMLSPEDQRGSALQKISRLDIKGRILLAMKGNREERSLLVRDGTRIVALAVLESPRITDSEVERFAGQKNVLEAVLRGISMKRRFIKQYPIVRNLTFNSRTPIDVALGLMKNLLTSDLRHLAGNKEVSDTVRKLATKMFRQKAATMKKS